MRSLVTTLCLIALSAGCTSSPGGRVAPAEAGSVERPVAVDETPVTAGAAGGARAVEPPPAHAADPAAAPAPAGHPHASQAAAGVEPDEVPPEEPATGGGEGGDPGVGRSPEAVLVDAPGDGGTAASPAGAATDLATPAPAPRPADAMRPAEPAADPRPGWLRVDLPGGAAPVWIPREEELVFRVRVDLGILGTVTAGEVVLRSGADRYVSGLPPAGSSPAAAARPGLEVGWIESHASGEAAGYRLDHVLHTRLLPQPWPRLFYMSTQKGSDPRRRELKIGLSEGKPSSWYRNDGHCKGCDNPEHFVESNWVWGKPSHCGKCKRAEHRAWRPAKSRAVPEGTVDTLSAVYLARETIRSGDQSLRFPMVEKHRLWDVEVRAGARRRIDVPAGRFDSRRVELVTRRPPGEELEDDEHFEGMFGIRGKIQIWMEASSGVPVRIDGELPVPVIGDLGVQVELVRYRGTPEGFAPVE